MSEKQTSYAVILNFNSGSIDVLSLEGMDSSQDAHEYIEESLEYSLTDCEWMVTPAPFPRPVNF
jgi:hypothetical protein